MDEVLSLRLAFPFRPIAAANIVSDVAGKRAIRIKNASWLIYVLRGHVEVGGLSSTLVLRSNDLLLLPPSSLIDLSCRYEEDAEWYALEFRLSGGSRRLTHSVTPFERLRVARPERVTDLLRRYVEAANRKVGGSTASLYYILQLIFAEIDHSREQSVVEQCGQGGIEVITSRVDAFIAAHYHEPISTFEIARALKYNPEYLERVYRQECQISIREAIQLRRLREARAQLLLQKNRSVVEIASMCGFNDTSYFRRAFKRATNMTPHRFRSANVSIGRSSTAVATGATRSGTAVEFRRSAGRTVGSSEPRTTSRSLGAGDALEPLNAGFFVSPGYGTHARRSLDSYELIFVTKGCLELYEDDNDYRLVKNQALILSPGRVHGGLRPFEPDLNFYWVHFRARDYHAGATPLLRVPKLAFVSDPELLAELFCMFISDQEAGALNRENAASFIALMLCVVGQGRSVVEHGRYRRSERTERCDLAELVATYIEDNFRKPISTAAIAEDMRFSPDYLERVFREHGESSIVQALHKRRIRAAREQLRNESTKNINEIAFECGYNDSGYFRRVFKRATGLTPKQYRSMFVQTHINAH